MAKSFDKLNSKILQLHNDVQENAAQFYNQHEPQIKKLHLLLQRLASFDEQIEVIQSYQREHGELPIVKGQDSTSNYLDHLFETKEAFTQESNE